MGTYEGRDGSCDWFSLVRYIYVAQAVYSQGSWDGSGNEMTQWSGVIMLEALWDMVYKALYKNDYYYLRCYVLVLTIVSFFVVWYPCLC